MKSSFIQWLIHNCRENNCIKHSRSSFLNLDITIKLNEPFYQSHQTVLRKTKKWRSLFLILLLWEKFFKKIWLVGWEWLCLKHSTVFLRSSFWRIISEWFRQKCTKFRTSWRKIFGEFFLLQYLKNLKDIFWR